MENPYLWAEELDCAVTVSDTAGVILYMNRKSQAVNGNMLGQNMLTCHNERSRTIIADLLGKGSTNTYTIKKHGIRKMIYQTTWRVDNEVRGLVEFSMEIPDEMPCYIRQ